MDRIVRVRFTAMVGLLLMSLLTIAPVGAQEGALFVDPNAAIIPRFSSDLPRPKLPKMFETSVGSVRQVSLEYETELGTKPTDRSGEETGSLESLLVKLPPVQDDGTEKGERLEELLEVAVSASRQLQAKGYETGASRNNIEAARGIRRPKLSNTTMAVTLDEQPKVYTEIPYMGSLATNIVDQNYVSTVTAITVPIFLGGKVDAMIRAATAMTRAMEAGQKVGEQDLKVEVAKMYFMVLRVRKLLQVAQEAEETTLAHTKDAERLYRNGLLTRNVVLAAQVAHANAAQDVLKAQNSLHLAEAAFNRLLWRPLQTPVRIVDIEIPESMGDLESLTARALRQRSELSALSSKAEALSQQAKVHRSTRLPNVALIGAHGYLESESLSPNSNFMGSVGMTWMPFDGGTSRAQQESANMEALAVTKLRDDARTAIELQVYQCWLEEGESRERVLVAEKATAQADENLRVTMRSFQQGVVNHTEVLDAQTLRTQAWSNYAHARYDAVQATYLLRRALGDL